MDDFTFIKWMDEVLDPVKVRREESFQSPKHRATMVAHEIAKLYNSWDDSQARGMELRLFELDQWWKNRETVERETARMQHAEKKRVREERAVKSIVFTDKQLEIARAAFSREEN